MLSHAQGSSAYAKALAKVGILTEEESAEIRAGLDKVGEEWEAGAFEVDLRSAPNSCMALVFPCTYGRLGHHQCCACMFDVPAAALDLTAAALSHAP